MGAADSIRGFLDRIVDAARERPGTVLALMLGFQLAVWTVMPALISGNLQLDLAEGLALGKEWQLGYWKHPPLPWWVTDLAYRVTGLTAAVYILGPLAAAVCCYAVWLLARDVAGPMKALIAVAALAAIHFYNISVVKFAHDQMQLPFWALTGLFFWRAIMRGRVVDWALAGLFLAGAFWSKYAAFVLAATLGLVLLIDPFARRAWRTPGPYVMAAVFALVLAPNIWWLVNHDFMPFRYVDDRAVSATRWYHYVQFPLHWTVGQFLYLLPPLAMLASLYLPRAPVRRETVDGEAAFNRRYVAALALGPFAVTTIAATLLGRLPIAMWGYPLWSFAPLAVVMFWPPALEPARLRRFAAAALAVLIAFPIGFAVAELGEPLIRDRAKATHFAGPTLAATITRQWQERTGTPLAYVGGARIIAPSARGPRESLGSGQFAANNIAIYSADRPHVIVNGDLAISPWIDAADLDRRGAVFVWQPSNGKPEIPENIRRAFPRAELQPPLVLRRRTLFRNYQDLVGYAIMPPRPAAPAASSAPR